MLILDEPTDGLDPNQKHQVRTLLADMAKDKAIIISTHILEEVDALCTPRDRDRARPDRRRRQAGRARGALQPTTTRSRLRLPARSGRAGPARPSAGSQGVVRVEASDSAAALGQLLAFPRGHAEILDPVCRAVEAAGLAVNEVYVERGRLDEVFRDLTAAA